MSNNKQDHIVDTNKMVTAVEWLFNNYVDKGVITIQAIEQAKAMEKEQIMDAFDTAYSFNHNVSDPSAQEYYNKTYEQ